MLDIELLRQLYPSASDANLKAFSEQSERLLGEFGIAVSRNRLHFFLAQLGHESGGLRITEENLNYSAQRLMVIWPSRFKTLASTEGFAHDAQALANKVYGGRMGNDSHNDGWTYRGRGFIQITGKDGYDKVGAIADLGLVGNPDLVIDRGNALRVACSFWNWKKLNPKCDAGDFTAVTRTISGGTIGLSDRYQWLQKVQSIIPWPLGGDAPPASPQPSLARIRAAQVKLKSLGLYSGSIDGIIGRNSRTALRVFQAENGLHKTGALDQATLAKLQV